MIEVCFTACHQKWIRLGNCSTREVEALIRRKIGYISKFIEDDVVSFLALS